MPQHFTELRHVDRCFDASHQCSTWNYHSPKSGGRGGQLDLSPTVEHQIFTGAGASSVSPGAFSGIREKLNRGECS